ncbi:hypothetical protein [Noviherbaspirillum saxi]|uniref:hypothetical protein n=1 Tax=Noviherbaspirillum saxi TaxID=2320863 RepID=UPI0011C495CD|nr:hypothetical protein [Noviherbaspirillum saxi]
MDDILILLYGSDNSRLARSSLLCLFQPRHSTAVVTVIDQDWKNFSDKFNFYFSGLADFAPGTCFIGQAWVFFSVERNYFPCHPAPELSFWAVPSAD